MEYRKARARFELFGNKSLDTRDPINDHSKEEAWISVLINGEREVVQKSPETKTSREMGKKPQFNQVIFTCLFNIQII